LNKRPASTQFEEDGTFRQDLGSTKSNFLGVRMRKFFINLRVGSASFF